MTNSPNGAIIRRSSGLFLDDDGLLSYHYHKGERQHRRALWRVAGDRCLIQDPATREEVLIGRFIDLGGGLVIAILTVT